jgi:micrococcal nuclease
VVRVVDGDTIHVEVAGRRERVRYVGVDTPEAGDCGFAEAGALNARLVSGRRVRLEPDVERRDRHGRLLAHVRRLPDGVSVQDALVRAGWARTLPVAPNVSRAPALAALEAGARAAGRGLWAKCAIPD